MRHKSVGKPCTDTLVQNDEVIVWFSDKNFRMLFRFETLRPYYSGIPHMHHARPICALLTAFYHQRPGRCFSLDAVDAATHGSIVTQHSMVKH